MPSLEASDMERILAAVDPVIQGILRRKMHVSLRPDDDRRDNQEALDLLQNARLEVLKRLERWRSGEDRALDKPEHYAAVVAYHQHSEFLRARYPAQASLKNRLRFFLRNSTEFAVWESADEDIVCGFSGWRAKSQILAGTDRIASLKSNPRQIDPGAIPKCLLESMKPKDWSALLDGVFSFLDGPVELDDLVRIVGELFGVRQAAEEDIDAQFGLGAREDPIHLIAIRQQMMWLWETLLQFRAQGKREWLIAFLLNLPGLTRESRGEIEVFRDLGVASVAEIAAMVEITASEYRAANDPDADGPNLPPDPGTPQTRFEALWDHLPLSDRVLARMLGKDEEQKVINLRMVATQKAARHLRERMRKKNADRN